MRTFAFIIVILIVFIYLTSETFLASYENLIKNSRNPNFTRYLGRIKNDQGYDTYDKILAVQLLENQINAKDMLFM